MKNEFNRNQKLAVILLDFIILAELVVSLYWSNQFGDDLTRIFLFTYLPTVIVTLIIGKICIHRLGTKADKDDSIPS